MKILAVHHGHDASAALVRDGKVIADAPEERFSRRKHERSFPLQAIEFCLRQGNMSAEEIDCISLPERKLSAIHQCVFALAAQHPSVEFNNCGAPNRTRVRSGPGPDGVALPFYMHPFRLSPKCLFFLAGHHAAHAASAYYSAGVGPERVLVVTMDGNGEGMSIGIWRGEGNGLSLLKSFDRNGSLGWFYSNVTEALGWRHSSDEWKVMELAPFGTPEPNALRKFHPEYSDGRLIRQHYFPRFKVWDQYGDRHYNGYDTEGIASLVKTLGREKVAAEAQSILEAQAGKVIFPWLEKERTGSLLGAGGLWLNVKMNQALWQSGRLSEQWIYPNPGDAGLAVGAALLAHATLCPEIPCEALRNPSLGPEFSATEIRRTLDERRLCHKEVSNPAEAAIPYLLENRAVAWFQGRMEPGPRALGNRSILMDPRRAENKDLINAKIKFREAFRPFCPSILAPQMSEYLVNSRDERFMMSSFPVRDEYRSKMPAVVHVDGTARPQAVHRETHPLYYELIERFGQATGVFAVLNTSFNLKGEPIVCTPRDALRTFFDSGLDVLIMDKFVIEKPGLQRP